MKKFLLLVVAFCFIGIGAQAQSTMGKGQLVGGVRLGLNGGGVPVGLVLDYGVAGGLINGNASISVGGDLGVCLYDKVGGGMGVWLSAAARGNFHYEFVQNLDTYLGLNLGICNGLSLGAHLGARYYFGNWGLNLELGGGTTVGGSLGVSFKL